MRRPSTLLVATGLLVAGLGLVACGVRDDGAYNACLAHLTPADDPWPSESSVVKTAARGPGGGEVYEVTLRSATGEPLGSCRVEAIGSSFTVL